MSDKNSYEIESNAYAFKWNKSIVRFGAYMAACDMLATAMLALTLNGTALLARNNLGHIFSQYAVLLSAALLAFFSKNIRQEIMMLTSPVIFWGWHEAAWNTTYLFVNWGISMPQVIALLYTATVGFSIAYFVLFVPKRYRWLYSLWFLVYFLIVSIYLYNTGNMITENAFSSEHLKYFTSFTANMYEILDATISGTAFMLLQYLWVRKVV